MFCCGICYTMFTGIYPESVHATPCGHLFHTKCILLCLRRSPKCPYCAVMVCETQLIKLQVQIDPDWKDTVKSIKANDSIINLDESLNIGNDSKCDASLMIIDPDESNMSLTDLFKTSATTKITTSVSAPSLSESTQSLLSVLCEIIPNSAVHYCFFVNEHNLIQSFQEGYSHVLIVNLHMGNPTGLVLFDLIHCLKINVTLLDVKDQKDFLLNAHKIRTDTNHTSSLIRMKKAANNNDDKDFQKFVHFVVDFCNDIFQQNLNNVPEISLISNSCYSVTFKHGSKQYNIHIFH
ncbi:uncharacterized protein LOC126838718 [Adelges cooleyi]|uniref:uncharacterized protein LOC126838718 n=1 Tax=Adelges cooleyi TaxID=133065 RepID=UPI00218060FA|nr:uncharacterized protein LOC126838718 [Adelges cooleyi]XP_050429328.1 uncharacterized protein LOC126838718 [Adelges cooleyi]